MSNSIQCQTQPLIQDNGRGGLSMVGPARAWKRMFMCLFELEHAGPACKNYSVAPRCCQCWHEPVSSGSLQEEGSFLDCSTLSRQEEQTYLKLIGICLVVAELPVCRRSPEVPRIRISWAWKKNSRNDQRLVDHWCCVARWCSSSNVCNFWMNRRGYPQLTKRKAKDWSNGQSWSWIISRRFWMLVYVDRLLK